MKKLTKPMGGIEFFIGRFLFNFNFAKSFLWAEDVKKENCIERKTIWFGITTLKRDNTDCVVLSVIVLPFKIMIGY